MHFGAGDVIQQKVAVGNGAGIATGFGFAHDERDLETETPGAKRGGAGVIGLESAGRDDAGGVLAEGVGEEKLEFADFVAGLEEAGEIVAPEENILADLGGEAGEFMDRRGEMGEVKARRGRHTERGWGEKLKAES